MALGKSLVIGAVGVASLGFAVLVAQAQAVAPASRPDNPATGEISSTSALRGLHVRVWTGGPTLRDGDIDVVNVTVATITNIDRTSPAYRDLRVGDTIAWFRLPDHTAKDIQGLAVRGRFNNLADFVTLASQCWPSCEVWAYRSSGDDQQKPYVQAFQIFNK